MDWETIELLGYAHYSSQGYRILTSLVKNESYDFVAEKDGQFIKVNVKRAGLKDKNTPNSWSISQAGGAFDIAASKGIKKVSQVDVYLAYLPAHKRFIELSGDFFDAVSSKSRLIPKHFL
ncbi:group I intron-associated PD-(D/E)XK endonuclease [Citrobacter portucalensis]|uniref:group I intron-associated PD-(D/E)XK endonuclease n=1 Tax=Citrobacter portucalensis TaxID=1639133 RepID=UPI003B2572D6